MVDAFRDYSRKNNAISSLENCAVQITCRDDYIGWNQYAFIENILTLPGDDARLELQRLLGYIEDGISGIDYSELCTEMTVRNPTNEDIRMLLDFAANAYLQKQSKPFTTGSGPSSLRDY